MTHSAIRQRQIAGLKAAMDLIQHRACDRLRLVDMAAAAKLSPFHFHRAFRNYFGVTPKQAIFTRQIEQAKRLMRAGQPLRAVAAAAGFTHQSALCSRFRQATGMSPSQWLAGEAAESR